MARDEENHQGIYENGESRHKLCACQRTVTLMEDSMTTNSTLLAVPFLPTVVHGRPFYENHAVEVDGDHFKKTLDGPNEDTS